jgi:homocitrate synthase NifV
MRKVTLIDTTLRDGAQAPNIFFTHFERLRIVDKLVEIGITEIEAGIPVMGDNECNTIKTIVKEFPSCRISSWCRANSNDITMAGKTGCDTVHISFPVSDVHLKAIHRDELWLFSTFQRIVSEAMGSFNRVTVGLQDASRAPLPRIISLIQCGLFIGVQRFRIADTIGILTPLDTSELISNIVKKNPSVNLDFHAHNDFGMATANAVTALMSGANAVSVTVNGIGERAGNAALEEVVMSISRNVPYLLHGLNTSGIVALCRLVAFLAQCQTASNKPITGSSIFTHESGIHCHALANDKTTYEPFDPSQVGHEPSTFVAGSHSGTSGIRTMLGEIGKDLTREELKSLFVLIQKSAHEKKRSLVSSEVKQLFLNEKNAR